MTKKIKLRAGKECLHNALRKKDSSQLTYDAYVCGNCSQMFEVEKYIPPLPNEPKPMEWGKSDWGYRDRQA